MAGYVSNWGNDINSGNDWAHACASFQGAADKGHGKIYAKGFFDEQFTGNIIGKGAVLSSMKVKIGIRSISKFNIVKDCILINWRDSTIYDNCYIQSDVFNLENNWNSDFDAIYCAINALNNNKVIEQQQLKYCTLYGGYFSTDQYHRGVGIDNCVFAPNQSAISLSKTNKYSLIIAHPIKLVHDANNLEENDFTTPASMTELRERAANPAGGNPEDYFVGCQLYTGPATEIFNDPANDDYTLKPGTIATYMSYEGSYVGKYPPSLSWKFPDDFSNITNFTSNKITDQTTNATADGTIRDLGAVRPITTLPVVDNPAYRNGVNLNTEDIVAGSTTPSGSLQLNHVYKVEGGTIEYDYYPDDPDTTVNFDAGSFFPCVEDSNGNVIDTYTAVDTGATVREIFIEKFDRKMKWKFSQTDSDLSSAVAVTMLAGQPAMVNVDSNNEPTYGNGDDGFDESTAVELKTRYIQPILEYMTGQIMAY